MAPRSAVGEASRDGAAAAHGASEKGAHLAREASLLLAQDTHVKQPMGEEGHFVHCMAEPNEERRNQSLVSQVGPAAIRVVRCAILTGHWRGHLLHVSILKDSLLTTRLLLHSTHSHSLTSLTSLTLTAHPLPTNI